MERERMDKLLSEALVDGNLTSLQTLLQKDQLILDRSLNHHNDMPLHIASMLGRIDFVKDILTRKPELVIECDSQGRLPLHVASANGHMQIVKALVSAKPETCLEPDHDGLNPLHLAAIRGRQDVVKELVRVQPDAAKALAQHETILHLCVKHNQLEVLKFLVKTMPDREFVNSKDADGNTILHLAVADKQIETIKFLLLNNSIELDASNANGHTASDLLAQGPRDSKKGIQMIHSLMRAGATEAMANDSLGQAPRSSRSNMVLGCFKYLYNKIQLRTIQNVCGLQQSGLGFE